MTTDDPSLFLKAWSVEGFPGNPTALSPPLRPDAGFFSSSLLEVAGEALVRMTPEGGETCVRVVCNFCLNSLDVQTARAAKWGMHREWYALLPAEIGAPMKARLQRFHDFLSSGFLKVKVLPPTRPSV